MLYRDGELPFLIAHLSLYKNDGTSSDTGSFIGRGSVDNPPMLYGHLISTVEQLEDLQGNIGLFLLFADVSIRMEGRYQLGISLSRLTKFVGLGRLGFRVLTLTLRSPESNGLSEHGTHLAQVRTQPFDVVPRDEYVSERV